MYFFFDVLTLPSQISPTLTGWSGSLIQRTKSLRSFPCEEHMNNDLLFSTEGERFSVSSLYRKGSLRGWTLFGDLLSQSSSNGVVSVCVSHSVLQPPIALCIQHWDCLVEAVAGAQDKFCLHIFTYMCFHLSLNTLNVYSEVIWCLSLTP